MNQFITSDVQKKVQSVLDELVSTGTERGLQVAAYLRGELVVHAWSGIADKETGKKITKDTLFPVFSASKGITATVIHQLVQKGKLNYDTPIAHYWPEFAKHGKDQVTMGQILTHQAGIPHMPTNVTVDMFCDWDAMVQAIANLELLWEPGTKTGYHAFTFGWILGEIARRVDGRAFSEIVQDQICQPLNIQDDMYFGIPANVEDRVAKIGNPPIPWEDAPDDSLIFRATTKHLRPGQEIWNQLKVRKASIPGAGLITNAHALARHYAALCEKGMDGVQLLSSEQLQIASTLQTDEPDVVLFGAPIRKGLGYWYLGEKPLKDTRFNILGHTGAGGITSFVDVNHNFAFALVKNEMTFDHGQTENRIISTIREGLGIKE